MLRFSSLSPLATAERAEELAAPTSRNSEASDTLRRRRHDGGAVHHGLGRGRSPTRRPVRRPRPRPPPADAAGAAGGEAAAGGGGGSGDGAPVGLVVAARPGRGGRRRGGSLAAGPAPGGASMTASAGGGWRRVRRWSAVVAVTVLGGAGHGGLVLVLRRLVRWLRAGGDGDGDSPAVAAGKRIATRRAAPAATPPTAARRSGPPGRASSARRSPSRTAAPCCRRGLRGALDPRAVGPGRGRLLGGDAPHRPAGRRGGGARRVHPVAVVNRPPARACACGSTWRTLVRAVTLVGLVAGVLLATARPAGADPPRADQRRLPDHRGAAGDPRPRAST